MVLYRELTDQNLMRRITVQGGSLVSTAGSIIALTTVSSDQARSVGLEFANYSARYGQFRVHKMMATFVPCFPASGSPTASVASHTTMLALGQRGDTNPTALTLLSNPECKVFGSDERITITCNWRKYLDAHLFSSVNSAIPADQVLKIYIASMPSPAVLPVSTTIFTYTILYDVEFSQPI